MAKHRRRSVTSFATASRSRLAVLGSVVALVIGTSTVLAANALATTTPPAISTTALPAGIVGAQYETALVGKTGIAPYTWHIATGSLPSGLTLAPNGVISGAPKVVISASVGFALTDSETPPVTVTKTLALKVTAPTITTTALAVPTIGAYYSAGLVVSGGLEPRHWTLTKGPLPAGLTLNTTTGLISGTPTTAGAKSFTVTVVDSSVPAVTATKALSLAPAKITIQHTAIPVPIVVGQPFSLQFAAHGGHAPYTFSTTSTLPAGVHLNGTTGLLSGAPTAVGTKAVAVKVTDTTAPTKLAATSSVSLPVVGVGVTNAGLPGGTVGQPYTAQLTAIGGKPSYAWKVVTGVMPLGLTLNAATGAITGTPGTAVAPTLGLSVTDSSATKLTSKRSYVLAVRNPGPGPVTGLVATTSSVNVIQLSWVNPSDPALTGVMIRRSVGATAPDSPTAGILVATTTGTTATYTDAGLALGTQYTYSLFAAGSSSSFGLRASVTATAGATVATTAPVSGLTAIPAQTSIQLSWVNPSSLAFAGVIIRRASGPTAPATPTAGTLVTTTTASSTSYTDSGLTTGTQYSYSVFAFSPGPTYASGVDVTSTTLGQGPSPVAGVTAVPSATSVALSWTNPTTPGFAGVTIRRAVGATAPASPTAGTLVTTTTGATATFTDTGVALTTQYSYALFAFTAGPLYATGVDVTTTTLNSALGTISGHVAAATGGLGLTGVTVDVYNGTSVIASASTVAGGSYSVVNVPVSSAGYSLCFDASAASGGPSTTGYGDECYNNIAWTGAGSLPDGLTPVPVTANATTTVNAALGATGAATVSGTVTAIIGGAGIGGVSVLAFNPLSQTDPSNPLSRATTAANGTYRLLDIPPGTYDICFDGALATSLGASTGFQDQCYNNVGWDGSASLSSATTKVLVGSGSAVTGINARLTAGIAISGTVTAASNGAALAKVTVSAYSVATGARTSPDYTTETSPTGTYSLTGLAPSAAGYDLCFDASHSQSGPSQTGYLDQCYQQQAWDGQDDVPATSKAEGTGAAGSSTPNINAALAAAGAITGTVTAAAGGAGVSGVQVQVYDPNSNLISNVMTAANGTYRVTNLAASPVGYTICFDASAAALGASTVGYLSQCYQSVAWDGIAAIPHATTAVPVTAGGVSSGINASLSSAGAITGTVTAATGGAPLAGVAVTVFQLASNTASATATTAPNGTYTIAGLTPGSGSYAVCFDAASATGGTTTGYADQCYRNVVWSGGQNQPPARATHVSVVAGQTTSGVTAALAAEGAVSGTVVAASGGQGVPGVNVEVLPEGGGNPVGTAISTANGSFTVSQLPAGIYTVCFDGANATGGASATGYLDLCYSAVSWAGDPYNLPPGTISVTVQAGLTTPSIGASLAAAAALGGTVTAASGGGEIAGVTVDLFDVNGSIVDQVVTGTDGSYEFSGLAAQSGLSVCFDASRASGGSSTTGYLNECYQSISWDDSDYQDNVVPAGATTVAATLGATTHVNQALSAAGAVSGTVTSANGNAPLADAAVFVYGLSSGELGTGFSGALTNSDGSYTLTGLAPSNTGYTICFNGDQATGGTSAYGYTAQCFNNATYDRFSQSPPTGTTAVSVNAGTTSSGINAALGSAGSIAGQVVGAGGGTGIGGAVVEAFDSAGDEVGRTTTIAAGSNTGGYSFIGLPPTTIGYTVCVDPSYASGGGSPTGYQGQCWNNVTWNTNVGLPSGTTPVSVGAGTQTAANFTLQPAGGISGSVTASGGGAIGGVQVSVTDPTTGSAGSGATLANGAYSINGLPPSATGYVVCFDPTDAYGGSSTTGYQSSCYQNSALVPVAAGSFSTANISLLPASGISGTVTAATGGAPLADVAVDIFDSDGNPVGYGPAAYTATDGTYVVRDLEPSALGYVVCFEASSAIGGASNTGYVDQCANQQTWTGDTSDLPPNVTEFPLTAGQGLTTNAALTTGAEISGVVTDSASKPLQSVNVDVYTAGGKRVYIDSQTTAPDGSYSILGLASTVKGYVICFDASGAIGASPTGYVNQCYKNVVWDSNDFSQQTPAVGTTALAPATGAVATGNAVLAAGAAIAGTVTAGDNGAALSGVQVQVFTSTGTAVGSGFSTATNNAGAYEVIGLPGSTVGYTVCFDAAGASGGASATGYESQCYKNIVWTSSEYLFREPAAGTTAVPVTAGSVKAVSVALPAASEIVGTITSVTDGTGVANASISIFDSSGFEVVRDGAQTDAAGKYSVSGLAASTAGYTICFDATSATGTATGGYASQCYKNVVWTTSDLANSQPSAGTTAVPVSAAATVTVNAALNPATVTGSISGTLTATDGGAPLTGVTVRVYDTSNQFVASDTTAANGTYTVSGLSASPDGYFVCFDAGSASGGTAPNGYVSQCYQGIVWQSWNVQFGQLPQGITPVPVVAGATATVSATLDTAVVISGRITSATSGSGLQHVTVNLYDNAGNEINSFSDISSLSGVYNLGVLPAGDYTVCFDPVDATGGPSPTGYLAQCYSNVLWDIDTGYPNQVPSGATTISATAGASITADASLASAGGISGTVTDSSGGPLRQVNVSVFSVDTGSYVAGGTTDGTGAYAVNGLLPATPSGYDVCFDPANAQGGSSPTGYLGQCYQNVYWPGGSPAAGSTAVTVSAAATSNANASLTAAGGISGIVTALTGGGGLSGVIVEVFDSSGSQVAYDYNGTDSFGNYSINGLVPSSTGYTVCFDASGAQGGSSIAGYLSQCFANVSWANQGQLPGGVTAVPVVAATSATANAALASAGGISGTISDAASGGGVEGAQVVVFDSSGSQVSESGSSTSTSSGRYAITGLVPSASGYTVCFQATNASGTSTSGYLSQCYNNIAWTNTNVVSGQPPSGTAAVPVSAGQLTTVSPALVGAGAISGTITAATGGSALGDVNVVVFNSSGAIVGSSYDNLNGSYTVIGLEPSTTGDTVCFNASQATGGSSTTGYLSRCYKTVAWDLAHAAANTPPTGTTPVPVTAGTVATVNMALATGGAIVGTVTAQTGGVALQNVEVDLFVSGTLLQNTVTDANGAYSFEGLPASTTAYVVCFDASFASGGSSGTGYVNQCYKNITWDPTDYQNRVAPTGVTKVAVTLTHSTVASAALVTAP